MYTSMQFNGDNIMSIAFTTRTGNNYRSDCDKIRTMANTNCTGNYFYIMNDEMMTIKTVHVQETTIQLTLIK